MRKLLLGICLTALSSLYAQSFDVASIKIAEPARAREEGRPTIEPTPGRLTVRNVPMMQLITWAYKISPLRISNPQVLGQERYDIVATANGPAKTEQMRIMTQSLLVDRFKLSMRKEAKEMQAFALVEAKGGHKLVESKETDGVGVTPMTAKMGLSAKHATLDLLTMYLSQPLRTPVIDLTGLKGRYDFEFDISQFVPMERDQQDDARPSPEFILKSLLPKQLGLTLESRKMPVEVFFIERIEKIPAEN
jgi:uncharacterized protein (TIGR03435 family)